MLDAVLAQNVPRPVEKPAYSGVLGMGEIGYGRDEAPGR